MSSMPLYFHLRLQLFDCGGECGGAAGAEADCCPLDRVETFTPSLTANLSAAHDVTAYVALDADFVHFESRRSRHR